MIRCDYNMLFYRVLYATLLVMAFTFTVILTNVFVDIDSFLSNNNKHDSQNSDRSKITSNKYDIDFTETDGLEEDENDPFYRTRRSISTLDGRGNSAHAEADNIQLHMKDPGLKKILTSRLASLLKELDEEETTTDTEDIKSELTTASTVKAFEKIHAKDNTIGVSNTDIFHLAMHNILLQGMLGHMDLNDVYNKVHVLVNNFNTISDKNKDRNSKILNAFVGSKEVTEKRFQNIYNEEHKMFEELIKCKKLESEIALNKLSDTIDVSKDVASRRDNKIYIKAMIEINEDNEKRNKMNLTNSTENVEGIIKLIYNGKAIKVNQFTETKFNDTEKTKSDQFVELTTIANESKHIQESQTTKTVPSYRREHHQNPLLNKLIEEYFKTRSTRNTENLDVSGEIKKNKFIRLKRQIKIRYEDDKIKNSPKTNTKKEDDDVYIEIETHFDGKGLIGDKKQKIVRSLIDKIEKALRSDIQETKKHIKFIKRTQDPIDGNKNVLINKISPPHDRIEPRHLDPIDKTLNTHENLIKGIDNSWKNQLESPKFLSISKSVNSAEMREVNIDYDNVLKNGIPQRLQAPINTDVDEDDRTITPFNNNDNGNVTLLLKDIDGTGFSIGINQYVGEPPDMNSIKMFNGLENLIKEYHQTYDQDVSNESDIDKAENFVQVKNKFTKKNHNILKRSLKEISDVHKYKLFNKSKSLFDIHLSPYKYDKTLFKLQKFLNKTKISKINDKQNSSLFKIHKFRGSVPVIDKNNLNKKLISSEILTPANLIKRKKRSLTVKKVSNFNSKMKLSKYINTHTRAYKRIFLNKKRNKRQINKIRIIARDPQNPRRNSEENIFLISRENTYDDKATVIKEFDKPDTVIDARNHYDDIYPIGDFYRIRHNAPIMSQNFYDTRRSSNRLMSKYPHIFVNDAVPSKEEFTVDNVYDINKPYRIQPKETNLEQETAKPDTKTTVSSEQTIRNVEEIINAIMPTASRPNYKLTLKITPKTLFNISKGFKEVHTSVNKSFDENGLRYFSLFNLSQISKIEELNNTTALKHEKIPDPKKPENKQVNEQQKQIKTLLELHKKRVDTQLGNLIRESKHLEKMIDANSKNNINKTINILNNDITTGGTNDDKMNKILASIKKLQESYNLIKNNMNTQANVVTDKPKLIPNTPVVIQAVKYDDKITNEILKKIDTNTNILRTFLERFSKHLKPDLTKDAPIIPTTSDPAEIKLNLSKDWRRYNKDAFYGQEENKNATIPFIYAYQQNEGPLASMVYHGHLHTNAIQDYNKPATKIKPIELENSDIVKRTFNGSKFFMDENENDFKLAPNKPFINGNISINTTTT